MAPLTTAPLTTAPLTMAPLSTAPHTMAPLSTAPHTMAPLTTAPLTTAPLPTVHSLWLHLLWLHSLWLHLLCPLLLWLHLQAVLWLLLLWPLCQARARRAGFCASTSTRYARRSWPGAGMGPSPSRWCGRTRVTRCSTSSGLVLSRGTHSSAAPTSVHGVLLIRHSSACGRTPHVWQMETMWCVLINNPTKLCVLSPLP